MFSQLAVTIASCITTLGCANNSQSVLKTDFIVAQSKSNIQQLSNYKKSYNSKEPSISAYNAPFSDKENYMTLTTTEEINAFGNPIYELKLFVKGSEYQSFKTVSGRYNTQSRDRDRSGTEAPLPNSFYKVSSFHVPGTHPEVGGRFLPIYPQFTTGRTALGIHYDPSFNKSIEKDGTAGCIALTSRSDLDQVLKYVQAYQPQRLEVRI